MPTFDLAQAVQQATQDWKRKWNMTREEMIADWEKRALLDPICPGCQEFYQSPRLPIDVFAPSHKASGGCESGKRPHCTCDTCF
jgi:hypothetical protein